MARKRPPLSAAQFIPPHATLERSRRAAADCRGCDLYRRATQTVFGAGAKSATVLLVGEQPGNDEDLAGLPFVGPAGRVLDRALEDAGIPRDTVSRSHGTFVDSSLAPLVIATVHPSSILRQPNDEARHEAMRQLVKDFRHLAEKLGR